MTVLFWSSVGVIALAYAGYPLVVMLLSCLTGRVVKKGRASGRVSYVVAAYNEEERIGGRIENLLNQTGVEVLEVLVGSDGSQDGTNAIVSGFGDGRVRLVALAERSGKPAALNACMREAKGEALVFADVRQRWEPEATQRLLENLADETVACVSGELMLEATDGGSEGVGLYWSMEKAIRKAESRVFSTLGATGAIYAVRRADAHQILPDTLLDDVVIPLLARSPGRRIVFEPAAVAHDRAVGPGREWTRKVRTLAGNFQLLFSPRGHGNPCRPGTVLQFLGHKVSRLLVPVAMAGTLVGTFAFEGWTLLTLLGLQGLGYLSAAAGWALQRAGRHSGMLGVPLTLVTLNLAVVAGCWRYVTGGQGVRWERVGSTQARRTVP